MRKIELKDEDFNLIKFKQDSEGYIEKLLAWKLKNERYHLSRNSFKQIRHKKVYGTAKPLRWWFFGKFTFFLDYF